MTDKNYYHHVSMHDKLVADASYYYDCMETHRERALCAWRLMTEATERAVHRVKESQDFLDEAKNAHDLLDYYLGQMNDAVYWRNQAEFTDECAVAHMTQAEVLLIRPELANKSS